MPTAKLYSTVAALPNHRGIMRAGHIRDSATSFLPGAQSRPSYVASNATAFFAKTPPSARLTPAVVTSGDDGGIYHGTRPRPDAASPSPKFSIRPRHEAPIATPYFTKLQPTSTRLPTIAAPSSTFIRGEPTAASARPGASTRCAAATPPPASPPPRPHPHPTRSMRKNSSRDRRKMRRRAALISDLFDVERVRETRRVDTRMGGER